MRFALSLLILVCLPYFGFAEDEEYDTPPPPSGPVEPVDPQVSPPQFAPIIKLLHPQHGTVTIGDGLATMALPDELAYLPPAETDIYMREIVNYPRTIRTLGSLIPTHVAIGSPAGWNALILYREDGHVDGTPARELDANILIKHIMDMNKASLKLIDKKGYRGFGVSILGWADAPFYNDSTHVATWALHTQPRGNENNELNYHVDVLGRSGVLSLLIVAKLEQFPLLQSLTRKMATTTTFNAPHRYADFNPQTDKTAPYGILDLIEGHTAKVHAKPN